MIMKKKIQYFFETSRTQEPSCCKAGELCANESAPKVIYPEEVM